MSKKPLSQKRAQRQQQEREALNNIFNVFLTGLAAECYLFMVYRGYIAGSIDSLLVWDKVLHVLMWIGAAVLVGGGLLALVKKADAKVRKIGLTIGGTGLFFALSGLIMTYFYDIGVSAMCTAVPILTVLMLIYFLYQRDCFINTLALVFALFAVWLCDRGLAGHWQLIVRIGAAAMAVLLAVFGIAARRIQFNEGKLGRWQIFPADCEYRMVYVVSVVSVVLVALSVLIPALAYYMIWAAVIALFAELAYYTTKMM